jgi:anti-sigma regulatory factor (Ser/Thr protein kinase)
VTILYDAPAATAQAETAVFDPISGEDISLARQWTHLVLIWQPYETAENAALVVSELLGNALLHGGWHVTLTIVVGDDTIKIEVTDEGVRSTTVDDRPKEESGRGRFLVESLAELATSSTATGTTVRATMRNPKGSR